MKVSVARDARTVFVSSMKIGQVGVIVSVPHDMQEYKGKHIWATYTHFVLLEDSQETWNHPPHFEVELLPPGTQILLTVEV